MADFSRLPGPNADLWDWQLLAACRGVDSSLFFHPEGERGAARSARENSAKEVCMRCPVRAECAAHALAVREPYGVWGGLTEDEREELMGRARNRPSTTHQTVAGSTGGNGAMTAAGGPSACGTAAGPAPGTVQEPLVEAAPGAASGAASAAALGADRGIAPERTSGYDSGMTTRGSTWAREDPDPTSRSGAGAEASWGEDAVPRN